MTAMRIGALAAAGGCTVETVRFYEREGLLPAAPRSQGNYRLYGDAHLARLRFIRRCRSLDMAHEEIHALLRLVDAPRRDCTGVNELLDEHIEHVGERIHELQALERDLVRLRGQCTAVGETRQCAIIHALANDDTNERSPGGTPAHLHRTHR